MADWSPLRTSLRGVEVQHTFSWTELDSMVGGLPPSAYVHSAFWKGTRTGWPGFTTIDVRIGRSVTFVRSGSAVEGAQPLDAHVDEAGAPPGVADVVLVGCVKRKLDHAAPAKDLYTSPLFRKERRYAEASGRPWFILSAEHGLVAPNDVLEPYELRLSNTSRDYRRAWGVRVVQQLQTAIGPLQGKTLEVHAGAAYTNALRLDLQKAGAHLMEPLRGRALGQRLQWYGPDPSPSRAPQAAPSVDDLIALLRDPDRSLSPAEFLAIDDPQMRMPGLYSWWVDDSGAQDLTTGLGAVVEPGLIYAGLAGATRSRSGRKSTNTLRGRIRGMHLGGRHDFSTFRLSLGSVLAAAGGHDLIDENQLTVWMHQHLRLIAIPVEDADALDSLETGVLTSLDPPLNLDKRPKNELRVSLSQLRKRYGKR